MKTTVSFSILIVWLMMVFSSLLVTLTPNDIHLPAILQPPGNGFWLGADDLGRPVFDRLAAGAQISFVVAASVTLLSAVVGILIGALAGWYGGRADQLVVRLVDMFMAFPGLLLAIALAGILGPGLSNLVIALSVVGWVGFARLTRAQVMVIKHRDHIQAARSLGTTHGKIILQHLLPLIAAPLIVEATFMLASVIIAEAGLSFLGIGIQPPQASWGNMIKDGTSYLLVAPHMVMVPGIALALVVLAINQLGDALRDRFDRKLKQ